VYADLPPLPHFSGTIPRARYIAAPARSRDYTLLLLRGAISIIAFAMRFAFLRFLRSDIPRR